MRDLHSDALVFFGATGDLAYKKIFPSLQAMVKRGTLNVLVIGVAKAGWNIDQLRARAHDYVEEAWRIVDPVLKANTPVYEYEPGTWGPREVEERIVLEDGWHNPVVSPVPACAEAA
jgi:glucose-6-phosphate 1-dehydrogenase